MSNKLATRSCRRPDDCMTFELSFLDAGDISVPRSIAEISVFPNNEFMHWHKVAQPIMLIL